MNTEGSSSSRRKAKTTLPTGPPTAACPGHLPTRTFSLRTMVEKRTRINHKVFKKPCIITHFNLSPHTSHSNSRGRTEWNLQRDPARYLLQGANALLVPCRNLRELALYCFVAPIDESAYLSQSSYSCFLERPGEAARFAIRSRTTTKREEEVSC
jgi:hypothetical protein